MVSHREKYTFHFTEMIDVSPSFKMDKFRKGDFVRVRNQITFQYLYLHQVPFAESKKFLKKLFVVSECV